MSTTPSLRRLIAQLRKQGVTVEKTAKGVRVTPRSKVPPADLARLTAERDAVRALLTDETDDDDARPTMPPALSPSDYRAAGLERFRKVWTHPEGDEVAAKILSGVISLDEATRAEAARLRRLGRLGHGVLAATTGTTPTTPTTTRPRPSARPSQWRKT